MSNLPQISSETAHRLARHSVHVGDILFARRGVQATGLSALMERQHEGFICGTGAILLRVLSGRVNPTFLSFALTSQTAIDWLKSHAVGAVMPNLNTDVIRGLPLLIPPPQEQAAIASMLGTLDEKIELNRRMNETLEAIAQAIFKSWFVDFGPVHPKAEGRKPEGIPAQIAALFPSSFSSELDMPSGWVLNPFTQLADISRDTVVPGDYPNEVFAHYSIPAFDEGKMPVMERGEAIKSNKFLVQPVSVLLSKLNPRIPRVWKPKLPANVRSICSTEYLVLRPNNRVTSEYLYSLCGSNAFQEKFATMVTGTSGSHQRVKPEYLYSTAVVLPSGSIIEEFTRIARPMLDRCAMNLEENATLATLRDTLLPKLLSGEVRITAADSIGVLS